MIKKLSGGFKKLTSSLGKLIVLALICLALALGIVCPLWKWATTSPKSYTIALLAIFAALFVVLIIRTAVRKGPKTFLFFILKLAAVIGGVGGAVFFILNSNRIAALIVFIAAVIIYAILSLGDKKK